MNERIEKLARECYQAPEFDYEKFAELIVRECAEVADCHWRNQCPGHYVKEHFGVEE